MPQFDIYLRNALQWGIGHVWAESPDEALGEARRLIEDDPTGFQMFYDGEFCDTVTEIRVCEPGDNDTLAAWRGADHGRVLAPELLGAAEAIVSRWDDRDLANAVRRFAAVIAKAQ
jgi:hypothetical protein